jgi:hypothetical protein
LFLLETDDKKDMKFLKQAIGHVNVILISCNVEDLSKKEIKSCISQIKSPIDSMIQNELADVSLYISI